MTNAPKSHITVDVPGLPTAHMELTTGETVEAVLSYAAQKWGEALAAGEAEPQQDSPADVLRSLFDAVDDGLFDDDDDDELADAPTFAKGDRVKLIDDEVTSAKYKIGDLGTVLSQYDFFGSSVVSVEFDDKTAQTVYATNIEHVEEPTDEEPKPLANGDRVVLVTRDVCSDARVGSLGTVTKDDYVGGDSVRVEIDGWRSQILYTKHLARVIVKSPEKGDKVVRTGDHVVYGGDFDGRESVVGMTGVVYRDAYRADDPYSGVRWDEPTGIHSTSSIAKSSLTVIE